MIKIGTTKDNISSTCSSCRSYTNRNNRSLHNESMEIESPDNTSIVIKVL